MITKGATVRTTVSYTKRDGTSVTAKIVGVAEHEFNGAWYTEDGHALTYFEDVIMERLQVEVLDRTLREGDSVVVTHPNSSMELHGVVAENNVLEVTSIVGLNEPSYASITYSIPVLLDMGWQVDKK